jgi:hypothetical protein
MQQGSNEQASGHARWSLAALHRFLERLGDESLVGNSCFGRRGLYSFEQLLGHAHVDSLALGLKLEADRSHDGQVVLGKIGLRHKLLGGFIAFQNRQSLFHSNLCA